MWGGKGEGWPSRNITDNILSPECIFVTSLTRIDLFCSGIEGLDPGLYPKELSLFTLFPVCFLYCIWHGCVKNDKLSFQSNSFSLHKRNIYYRISPLAVSSSYVCLEKSIHPVTHTTNYGSVKHFLCERILFTSKQNTTSLLVV